MVQTQVTVTIENFAPNAGTFLTPFWVGFHDGDFDLYDREAPASDQLERLAEDGNTAPISELFLNQGDGTVDGTILGAQGLDGPIDPSEVASQTFTLESEDETSRFFSYASMILPSNDAFIANGNPLANEIFDSEGNFLGVDFIVAGSQVLDAGTEVNDELVDSTAFFSQSTPDTGVVENGVIDEHPGFIPGGRILSEDGTTANAPGAFTNADFTAEGYQAARITVSIVDDPVTLTANLDGSQEVDAGDPDASGTSTLTLNQAGNNLEYSLTVSGLDFGANGLIEGGAQTPDTSDDVTRIHIHNGVRGENGPVAFSLFNIGDPELVGIQGNQDEDLEITPNQDGSVTLSGIWEGTDPANNSLLEFVSQIREAGEDTDVDLYWNVHTEEFPAGAIRGQLLVDEDPVQVAVTIENLAPEAGTFLTPFWVGFHDGDFDLYDREAPASDQLERLAEDGNTAPISELFLNQGDGTVDGTILGAQGLDGPIDPGEITQASFILDSDDQSSRYFSYASMILPSNDAFIANGNPLANEIFDSQGNFLGVDFIVAGSQVLDAGTEVNDELVDSTAFFSQSTPDTGVVENGVVDLHPGFIPGGRILSEDGTTANAPGAFTNADFTAEGYQAARITVSIIDDPVTLTANLDGSQEVDAGDPDASGTSTLTLNQAGNNLEYSLTVSGLDFGANGLIEGGAQTPDTSDDVTRIHIHNGVRGENGPVAFSLFNIGDPELVGIQGNQDDDLQITPNQDGSVTLSGIWEGTDPANNSLLEFVSQIREAGEDTDVDLYWNVHTEEFPAGAIRGQLVVNEQPLDDTLIRFRNANIATGTYLFAGEVEAQNVRDNFSPPFVEEGNAFNVSLEANDALVRFNRFQNNDIDGAFIFANEAESVSIRENFSDTFREEGIAFYALGADANLGVDVVRFRNINNNTYLFAQGAEVDSIRQNFSDTFLEEGVAFEVALA